MANVGWACGRGRVGREGREGRERHRAQPQPAGRSRGSRGPKPRTSRGAAAGGSARRHAGGGAITRAAQTTDGHASRCGPAPRATWGFRLSHLQQQSDLPAGHRVQLSAGIVGDGEQLVDAAQEESPLLVHKRERRQLGAEQPVGYVMRCRGGSRRAPARRERLCIVVRVPLELREELLRRGRLELHQASEPRCGVLRSRYRAALCGWEGGLLHGSTTARHVS